MNRFIVDYAIRSARLLENDREGVVLFGMVAHLNVVHLMPPGATPPATLEQMRSAGRGLRLKDGWVHDVPTVDADMHAPTMDGVRRLPQTADALRSTLRDAATVVRDEAALPCPIRFA